MERLTVKWKPKLYDVLDPIDIVDNEYSKANYEKMLVKLGEYEDAEEQGLLLRLLCKVGDIIWDVDYGKPCAYTITGYSFGTAEDYIDEPIKEDEVVYYYTNSNGSINGSFAESVIGESLFLSKEDAEKALAGKKEV